ncbi:MAG: GNAT family N-acetyltransferase [Bacteroidetes bacterium]|jgi:GNAT superfamily N-acetyltransferase|nr:GNAT family N-acetyltransferase [Bacteroidota bacterium]
MLKNLGMPSVHEVKLIEFTDLNFTMIDSLVNEAEHNGHDFIQRTIDDWNSGANKFDKPGERLWGLVLGIELIGIGGLNCDPYTEDLNTGRVRHLYVLQAYRRKGYATLLMKVIINNARQHFTVLRLFTDNTSAAEFYEKLGFQNVNTYKASHMLALT